MNAGGQTEPVAALGPVKRGPLNAGRVHHGGRAASEARGRPVHRSPSGIQAQGVTIAFALVSPIG